MGDKLNILFQYWNRQDSKALVAESVDVKDIPIEKLIVETTNYCRYSGRLMWILLDFLIRNIDAIDIFELINLTKKQGDISVLGLVADMAREKRNDIRFDQIINESQPNPIKEIFFYRVAKSKFASKITIQETLPIYEKWNYYSNELRYLTTDKELEAMALTVES